MAPVGLGVGATAPHLSQVLAVAGSRWPQCMQVLDWECGQLYWNCFNRWNDEQAALEKVKTKYLHEFGQRDLHFFLGTTQQFHSVAPNPWVIVGVFAPPFEHQLDLGIEA